MEEKYFAKLWYLSTELHSSTLHKSRSCGATMDGGVQKVAHGYHYSATNNEKITNPVNYLSHIMSTVFHDIWKDMLKLAYGEQRVRA